MNCYNTSSFQSQCFHVDVTTNLSRLWIVTTPVLFRANVSMVTSPQTSLDCELLQHQGPISQRAKIALNCKSIVVAKYCVMSQYKSLWWYCKFVLWWTLLLCEIGPCSFQSKCFKQIGCRGRVDKNTELKLWCFCSAECGFESWSWHLCPWARHLTIIASLHPGVNGYLWGQRWFLW